jgi:hypothetical protein
MALHTRLANTGSQPAKLLTLFFFGDPTWSPGSDDARAIWGGSTWESGRPLIGPLTQLPSPVVRLFLNNLSRRSKDDQNTGISRSEKAH